MLSAYLGLILFILMLWMADSYLGLPGCKAMAFLAVVLFAGLRYDVGVDYFAYERIYNFSDDRIEPVWLWFGDLLNNAGFASRAWFLSTSLVINGCVFYGIRKMSPDFFLSVLSYLMLGACFWESMNTVRQFTTVSILFAAAPFLLNNKKLIYIVFIAAASLFHASALAMLPAMFLLRMKIPKWGLVTILAVSWFGHDVIQRLGIFNVLANVSEYARYVNIDYDTAITSGLMKYFYAIVGIVIVSFSKRIKEKFEYGHIFVNATIFAIAIYFVFYDFLVLLRIMYFFSIYFIILIPLVKEYIRPKVSIIAIPTILLGLAAFLFKSINDLQYQFDFNLFR